MTTVQGRLGSQYSLLRLDDGEQATGDERYSLKVQLQLFPTPVTLWSGDYTTATKIMDFCQQHDGLAVDAAQKLYALGDPTALLDLVEQAKADPLARARRRVGVRLSVETDVLESEDAIVDVSQRMAAAARMCAVVVRSMTCNYETPAIDKTGIAFCWKAVAQAVELKHDGKLPLPPKVSKALQVIEEELEGMLVSDV
jgi:hypothetical protein